MKLLKIDEEHYLNIDNFTKLGIYDDQLILCHGDSEVLIGLRSGNDFDLSQNEFHRVKRELKELMGIDEREATVSFAN